MCLAGGREITKSYDAVYKWFDYLAEKCCSIIGYVIIPNHLHALIHLREEIKNLNTIIGNAKRFMAYEIIKRLEEQKAGPLLQELYHAVKKREGKKDNGMLSQGRIGGKDQRFDGIFLHLNNLSRV